MASFFPNVNKKEAYEALIYFNVPEIYASHIINLISGEIRLVGPLPTREAYYENRFNQLLKNNNRNLPMGNPLCPLISTLVLYKHFNELGLNLNKDLIVTGYADDNCLMFNEKGCDYLKKLLNVEVLTSDLISD